MFASGSAPATTPDSPEFKLGGFFEKSPEDVTNLWPAEPGVVRLRSDDRLVLVLEKPLTTEERRHTESALLEFLARKDQAIVLDGTFAQLYVLRRG